MLIMSTAYQKRTHDACLMAAEVLQNTFCPLTFVRNRIRRAFTDKDTGVFGIDPWQQDALTQRGDQHFLCCRQSGKTTVASALALWRGIHYQEQHILLLAPTMDQGKNLIRRIKGMRNDVGVYTVGSRFEGQTSATKIEFVNGSVIQSISAKNPGNIRGPSPTLIIEDESAFVSDETFAAARPMLGAAGKGGTYLMLSTPMGKTGHFWKVYATKEKTFTFHKMNWRDCPRLVSNPERLEADRRLMTPIRFAREYECEFMPGTYALFTDEMLKQAVDENLINSPLYSDEYFGFQPEEVTAATSEHHLGLTV